VLVRNTYLSWTRPCGPDERHPVYVPPYQVGKVMDGGALGEVIESNDPSLAPAMWCCTASAARVRSGEGHLGPQGRPGRRADPAAYLGALGLTGLTATWACWTSPR